jgi:hypothetical protein
LTERLTGGRPVATFTITRFAGPRVLLGALQMATHRGTLRRTRGLRFSRLLGSGSGLGFSIRPDLRLWGMFAVWDSEEDWCRFRSGSAVMLQRRRFGEETYSLVLEPVSAHGRWGGVDPFHGLPSAPKVDADPTVVVLTRASIRPTRQGAFWRAVPDVEATLRENPDLLLTFGFGEVPLARQGTLSVWRSAAAVRRWAYEGAAHAEVVRRTRQERWYSEDLFARFRLRATEGSFLGTDPLAPRSTLPLPNPGGNAGAGGR